MALVSYLGWAPPGYMKVILRLFFSFSSSSSSPAALSGLHPLDAAILLPSLLFYPLGGCVDANQSQQKKLKEKEKFFFLIL